MINLSKEKNINFKIKHLERRLKRKIQLAKDLDNLNYIDFFDIWMDRKIYTLEEEPDEKRREIKRFKKEYEIQR